ncbi:MAG TPA: ScpA family protein [Thermomicrobiales bacterium]|nr:ScpA family protein [Thermomicrobiales bacterium]
MTDATDSMTLTLANYQLRLPDFEGPLDVLLRLIERSQLAIEDVSLVAVTDQFLTVLEDMREQTPPETIAEFATVGTRLTVLKSRSLLPRPPKPDEDELVQSDLTAELAEYKRMKEIAQQLGARHASGLSLFTPPGRLQVSIPVAPKDVRLVPYEANVLLRSIRRRLTVVPKPAQMLRQRRIVSIREMIERVIDLTAGRRPIAFSRVTADYRSRTDVATAFLAVLVLVRRRTLQASQPALFADIELQHQVAVATDTMEMDGDIDDEFLN